VLAATAAVADATRLIAASATVVASLLNLLRIGLPLPLLSHGSLPFLASFRFPPCPTLETYHGSALLGKPQRAFFGVILAIGRKTYWLGKFPACYIPRDMPEEKVNFGVAMRLERRERGWSQWDLAQRSGIMPSEISKYENGHYEPNLANYFKLCEAFGWEPGFRTGSGSHSRWKAHMPFDLAFPRFAGVVP
jgi:DNA-binding XRE family transcriptional regulator